MALNEDYYVIEDASPGLKLLSEYILIGTGTPEAAVTARLGALYINASGGADVCLYSKETGDNTNTGWVAVATA